METEQTILSVLHKKTLLNILHTQAILVESFSELLKQYGLSSEQFKVLVVLQDQKGKAVNMSVIQEQMIAKASNTTRLVDKLLLKGLVIRETCPENRRKIEVSLTAKGLKLLHNMNPAVNLYEEKLAYNLTPNEHENLNLLLEKYRNKTV